MNTKLKTMKALLARLLPCVFTLGALFAHHALAGPTFEHVVDFAGDGFNPLPYSPQAPLVKGTNGNFYGTTEFGGTNNKGTVFKMTPTGVLTTLVNFTNDGTSNKGAYPLAGLVLGSDGNFYGTASTGGTHDYGTVFKMTPAGVLTTLVNFTSTGASNKGEGPNALVQGSNGNFYGTTANGGTFDNVGTVFKMTPAGVLTTLVIFTDATRYKGANPLAGLVQGSNGNFYGTTDQGGHDWGTVFKMTPAGVLTTLVNFSHNDTSNKGSSPDAALVQGSDGNFYGTTWGGGTHDLGTVFKMTTGGVLTTLVNFTNNGTSNKGAGPLAALVQASDGNFYGTTEYGGTNDYGTAFKITPAGTLTTLVNFNSTNGATPKAGVCKGSDGNLYGTTFSGGNNGTDAGTVFRLRFGPTPVTRAATAIASTTATLNGTVNPHGLATSVRFQIGTAANLAGSMSLFDTNLPGSTTSQAVSLPVTGLTHNTRYYFRVVAQNAENAIPQTGKILNFNTLP